MVAALVAAALPLDCNALRRTHLPQRVPKPPWSLTRTKRRRRCTQDCGREMLRWSRRGSRIDARGQGRARMQGGMRSSSWLGSAVLPGAIRPATGHGACHGRSRLRSLDARVQISLKAPSRPLPTKVVSVKIPYVVETLRFCEVRAAPHSARASESAAVAPRALRAGTCACGPVPRRAPDRRLPRAAWSAGAGRIPRRRPGMASSAVGAPAQGAPVGVYRCRPDAVLMPGDVDFVRAGERTAHG